MGQFNWTQYDLTSQEKNFSAHCGLFWYCNDYALGQNSWQYKLLSKSPYSPGLLTKSILDEADIAAEDYYQHLIQLFEYNYKPLGLVLITEEPSYSYRWDIAVSPELISESYSLSELVREVYSEICGEILDYYPSLIDCKNLLEDELSFPYNPSPEYDDEKEEYCSLIFCFNFEENLYSAEGDIF